MSFRDRLGEPRESLTRTTAEGERSFPTLDDYVDLLVQAREVRGRDDLLQRHDLLPAIVHHWVRKGQTGCRFAKRLARDPHSSGWLDVVVADHRHPDTAASVHSVLAAAGNAEAVLLVLPSVATITDLVELFAAVARHENWRVVEIPPEDERARADDEHVVVGLRWQPPGGGKESWPLLFAPFDEVPFTRRAPVTCMVVRTHNPLPSSEGIDLAAMTVDLPPTAFERFAKGSGTDKRLLLAGELEHAARARATLRVPRRLAAALLSDDS